MNSRQQLTQINQNKDNKMANPIVADLEAAVAKSTTVVASAIVLINGIADRVAAAIAVALENGATEAELAALNDEVATLHADADTLAAAVAANTPSAPPA